MKVMLLYIIIGVIIVVGMYFFSRQALHCHKQQFRTTDAIKKDYPQFPAYETYDELLAAFKAAL